MNLNISNTNLDVIDAGELIWSVRFVIGYFLHLRVPNQNYLKPIKIKTSCLH